MCDFSLQSTQSRPAKIGDKLTTRNFGTVRAGSPHPKTPGRPSAFFPEQSLPSPRR